MTEAPAEESFRNRENAMAFLVLTAATVLLGLLATAFAAEYAPVLAVVALVVTGLLLGLWRTAFRRSRVDTSVDGVRVVNPFHAEYIPWQELERCSGGRFLSLLTTSGRTVRAWSVQNSNWSHLRGQPGYADAVAGRIMSMRGRYGGG